MRYLLLVLCFFSELSPCNSTEGRRSLMSCLTRTDIEEKLEKLWQDAYVNQDDVAAKAYDEFNALINDRKSVHNEPKVSQMLYDLELTDSSGVILEEVKEAWIKKEQKIDRLLSFRLSKTRSSFNEKENDEK